MNLLKPHITTILITYLTALVLINILPINGSESTLNNNYTLGLRWDYLGHALVMIPLFPLLALKYNPLPPFTRSTLLPFTRSPLQFFTRSILPFFTRSHLLFITISIILAIFLEGLQYFISYRTYNVNDILAGGIGVGVGFVIESMFVKSKIEVNSSSNKIH